MGVCSLRSNTGHKWVQQACGLGLHTEFPLSNMIGTPGMLYRSPRGIVVDLVGTEDQIYALIEKAIATSNPDKLEEVMAELRAALKDHIQQARTSAASAWPSVSTRGKP
jgi:hypothetical protein